MDPRDAYSELLKELRAVATLSAAEGVLSWDAHTKMPKAGIEHRGEQSALLARLAHERFTGDRVGDLLAAAEGGDFASGDDSAEAAVLREVRRSYDKKRKLPGDLVAALSTQETLGQAAWEKARAAKDYAAFEPHLAEMLRLKREEADAVGEGGPRYDALLDDYEPHAKTEQVAAVLEGLRGPLVEIVRACGEAKGKVDSSILTRKYDVAGQKKLAAWAAKAVGYDFDAGRLDESAHPFCTGIAPGDTRITNRYDPEFLGDSFFGTLHEAGHAMYEQGLPKGEHFGSPLAEAVSLGIHESQSRMWENAVGRGEFFWQWAYPTVQATFKDILWDVPEAEFVGAVNAIQPSLIRTESDEATYNLHILIRFELEKALLDGDLSTADLPSAWDEKYQKYLGVVAPDVQDGCLQDVHWSAGLFGYFPTYTLGNLYAAQFYEQAKVDIPDLEDGFTRGEFAPLLSWLREHIHRHGSRYPAAELCQRVTSQPLSPEPLLNHLHGKAERFYGVKVGAA
jgi:carboxypeptidase Taq